MRLFIDDCGSRQIIHVPIYDRDIAICGDKYDLPLFGISTTGYPAKDGTCEATTFTNNQTGVTVMVFRDEYPSFGVIAHESLHAVNFIMHRSGFKPDRENDEPDAYLLGFIVNSIDRALSNIREHMNKSITEKISDIHATVK